MADDDIDELFDAVEKRLSRMKVGMQENGTEIKAKSSGPNNARSKASEALDLSDILDDLTDDEDAIRRQRSTKGRANSTVTDAKSTSKLPLRKENSQPSTMAASKCFQVFLGGSSSETGLSTTVNKRSCNRLRCSDCDFVVSFFDNHQWLPSTDYLFLRNNMPEYDRLRPKLIYKMDYRAYACQCKWKTVNELVDLQTQSDVKWFCGKH